MAGPTLYPKIIVCCLHFLYTMSNLRITYPSKDAGAYWHCLMGRVTRLSSSFLGSNFCHTYILLLSFDIFPPNKMFLWLYYVGSLSLHANLSHLMNTVLKFHRG